MQWDAVGQESSSKVSQLPPGVSFQIAIKPSVLHSIIAKCCIKRYPSAMPAKRKSYLPNINAKIVEVFKGTMEESRMLLLVSWET